MLESHIFNARWKASLVQDNWHPSQLDPTGGPPCAVSLKYRRTSTSGGDDGT